MSRSTLASWARLLLTLAVALSVGAGAVPAGVGAESLAAPESLALAPAAAALISGAEAPLPVPIAAGWHDCPDWTCTWQIHCGHECAPGGGVCVNRSGGQCAGYCSCY